MGRKNRKPPEPITLNIPVSYLSFSFFVSLRELWTPWRTDGFLFISVLHCLAWGLACCQALVCVCWMSEQTVKECLGPCCAVGLDSCWGWTVLMEWIALHKGRLSNGPASQGGHLRGSDRWMGQPSEACAMCALTRQMKDERVIEVLPMTTHPGWNMHAGGALVWILVFLGDLSRWKWHCGLQSHHLGTHLGDVMTGRRQYMPQRALCKTKLPVTSYGQVSFSVGTVGRQSRAGTILSTFQSLLELSMALTSWTDPLGPLVPGPSDIKCPWVRKEMSFWGFF